MTNRLAEVYTLGQSPWGDNIARDQIQQGTFQQMTETDGKRRKCYPLWYEATSLLMVYRKTGNSRYKQISKS